MLIIARISTIKQDMRSLADQVGLCKAFLAARYRGPVEFVIIQSQGSGEHLDTKELAQAEELIESSELDLVIVEDLGRICRRTRAVDICDMAEDVDTRLIAINDHIDTAQGDWRLNAFFASFKHEMSNRDTAARIRRSLRERFKNGGVIQFTIFGYIKPNNANSDADLRKDPEADSVYDAIFTKLEEGAGFAEVADWLNDQSIKPGPYARSDQWDGRMLARVVFNPILKGLRVRNNRMSKRVNSTGHHKSVKAPRQERLERQCPHLAFIDPDRYDRLIAKLIKRSEKFKRSNRSGVDIRENVPRKRTEYPGQHATCGCCGRLYYWGGHGQSTHMMCAGARDRKCWNTCSFNASRHAPRIVRAILERIEQLPEFDEQFRRQIEAQAAAQLDRTHVDERRLQTEEDEVNRQIERALDAVTKMGHSDALATRLHSLEGRLAEIRGERAELKSQRTDIPVLPSLQSLKERARQSLGSLAANDPEFGRLMRTLTPHLRIYPFAAIDTSRVVARALVTLDLAMLLPKTLAMAAESVLRQTFWVDLHDPPPYIAYRERVAELRKREMPEPQIAKKLRIKLYIVQRAMKIHREMLKRGINDAYQLLTSPPDDNPKFRLHKHRRYRYEPLAGFPDWPADLGK